MTHVPFLAALYLFIGSIVMLLVNELAGKGTEITRQQFVSGMFMWPGVVLGFCLHVGLAYVRRISGG